MTQLVVCLECARHVRVTDPSCPFCGGTARTRPRPAVRVAGLGRAAIMALGATVAGCGPGDAATPTDPGAGTGEAIAPIEAPSAPMQPVPPQAPVEVVAPSEPSEPVEVAPSEPVEVAPSEPEPAPPPPRPRTVPRVGAPAPAYGAAPIDLLEAPRPTPRRPPEDDNGGNVPLYGGPGLD